MPPPEPSMENHITLFVTVRLPEPQPAALVERIAGGIQALVYDALDDRLKLDAEFQITTQTDLR